MKRVVLIALVLAFAIPVVGRAQTTATITLGTSTLGALTEVNGAPVEEEEPVYLGACGAADLEKNSSEYLSVADNADMSTGKLDFSVIKWFKPESSSHNQDLLGKFKGGGHYEYLLHFVGTGADDQVYWYISEDGTALNNVPSGTKLVVGTYSMIYAYHENGVNIGISIDDGAVVVDAPAHTTGGHDGTAAFHIGGRDPYDALYGADGLAAGTGWWKRKLTAGEVTSIYNGGNGKQYADLTTAERVGLVAYWNLDEESGARVDSHGSNDLADNNDVGFGAGPAGACP